MPNWCYTRYVIESEPKQIQIFTNILDKLNSRQKPLIENGFGKLWMGNIVHLLGKDWKKVRCRGRIIDYELQNGTLWLNVESAWSELDQLRLLFLQRFPDAKVYYQSEESGMEIFQTNDTNGKFFTARYVIDSEYDGTEYFNTLKEVAEYVEDCLEIETEPTAEGIQKAIDKWTAADTGKRWMTFHEFEEVE